jgi:hypothetical protein
MRLLAEAHVFALHHRRLDTRKLDRIVDAYESFAHAANTRALKVIIEA